MTDIIKQRSAVAYKSEQELSKSYID
ncbi:hypothetical protein ACSFB8_00760 [Enterococcus faecalis]